MSIIQTGDKVRVIADRAGHGYPRGTEFIVKSTRQKEDGPEKYTEVHMTEANSWFFDTDVAIIHPPNNNRGKFIITDPIFIMDNEQYEEIKDNHEKYKEPDFEHLQFPIKSIHNQTKEPIIIHYIETTPYGPGDCEYEKQTIVNDSGMLCIAENDNEWNHETFGAKFETLEAAQSKFEAILNKL